MKKIILILLLAVSAVKPQHEEFRAVKITDIDSPVLYSDKAIAEAMDYLASINVNVILPVVWNAGYTQYQSSVMDSLTGVSIDPAFRGRDPLERLVIEARRCGIEVYPWFEYGFAAWYGTEPGHLLSKYPGWALRSADGSMTVKNGFYWMSAANPEVQDLIRKLTLEVIHKYDIDGVEYSDRIPAMPIEGGYDTITAGLYKSETGQNPPLNHKDEQWKKWRASKLNAWYRQMRDTIKSISPGLFLSSSPSIYPWGYDEYLQDVKTWLHEDIVDHYIPQLYRYNFQDYLFELNKAAALAGPEKINRVFAGILMNIGTGSNAYLISEDYLRNAMQANRDKAVSGEAFFFYEGLRKENDKLGTFLKNTFYSAKAPVPMRGGFIRRPPAQITNEQNTLRAGEWQEYNTAGFEGKIIRTASQPFASVNYSFNIQTSAYYDVYVYLTPNIGLSKNALYKVYTSTDTLEVILDQSNLSLKGWHKLASAYLIEGESNVISLDNTLAAAGEYTAADAAMIMINRKLSPDAVIPVSVPQTEAAPVPSAFRLSQNYPNPFNSQTKISFSVPVPGTQVTLKVYDMLGRQAAVLYSGPAPAGQAEVSFNASGLAGGVYFVRLSGMGISLTNKMIYLK